MTACAWVCGGAWVLKVMRLVVSCHALNRLLEGTCLLRAHMSAQKHWCEPLTNQQSYGKSHGWLKLRYITMPRASLSPAF